MFPLWRRRVAGGGGRVAGAAAAGAAGGAAGGAGADAGAAGGWVAVRAVLAQAVVAGGGRLPVLALALQPVLVLVLALVLVLVLALVLLLLLWTTFKRETLSVIHAPADSAAAAFQQQQRRWAKWGSRKSAVRMLVLWTRTLPQAKRSICNASAPAAIR